MSSANYITSRDLFMAHHWSRYTAFDSAAFAGFKCGRIVVKDGTALVLNSTDDDIAVLAKDWCTDLLKEPKAAESAPPVHEVLWVGDWIGVDENGNTVLFAPCAQRGATAVQAGAEFQARALAWSEFLASIRMFFAERRFTEVTTATLARSPGTEPFLDPLIVTTESDQTRLEQYLITSPEFNLKKALGAGLPRIFEIAKCFRNKEGGPHHRIEFHMLEWYRSFASLKEISDDTEALILQLAPSAAMKRASMRDLFREFAGFDLRPTSTRDELAAAATAIEVRTVENDDFNDIFHRIFLEKIEPKIEKYGAGGPVMISGYPPSMAALARIAPDGFADRFEVYWRGLEICNAFHELNDPSENLKRFEKDNLSKVRSGRAPVPVDDELMRAFDLGVPPAGGIALGLERLFMAVHQISDIEMVRPFLAAVDVSSGLNARRLV